MRTVWMFLVPLLALLGACGPPAKAPPAGGAAGFASTSALRTAGTSDSMVTTTTVGGVEIGRLAVAVPVETLPPIHDTLPVIHDTVPGACPVCTTPPPPPAPVPPPPPPSPVPPPAPAPVPPPPGPPGPPVALPPAPAAFRAGYDPTRLGASLLAGQHWQNVTAGADNGWTSMRSMIGGWALGSSATGATASVVGVYPDPTFGQAVRVTNAAGKNGSTAQAHFKFTPSQTVWVRWTMKLSPGFTAKADSVSAKAGESGTYKMAFLWPQAGAARTGRQSFVLASSGEFAIESPPQTGTTSRNLVATDATTPPPQKYGAFAGFYPADLPTMGGPYAPSNILTSGDWYAFYLNVQPSGPTSYIRRWFVQRLTVSGAWQPWAFPTWKGFEISGAAEPMNTEFWITGNKSGAAPAVQYLWLGPVEISHAKDPYGWDHFGR